MPPFTCLPLPGDLHARRAARRAASLDSGDVPLCSGAFSECTGLEATMEPKVIKAGGANYGPAQRVGTGVFATSDPQARHDRNAPSLGLVSTGRRRVVRYRLDARITMQYAAGEPVLTWALERALPTKFKAADLNANGTRSASRNCTWPTRACGSNAASGRRLMARQPRAIETVALAHSRRSRPRERSKSPCTSIRRRCSTPSPTR